MSTKFNLNREPVNDDEINSHKDFDELVKKFKTESIQKARSDVSFLKNKKATYSTIIAGVVVLCTVTYFTVFKKETSKQITHDKTPTLTEYIKETKTTKSFIAPPIAKLNVPYTSYKVKAEAGSEITHKPSQSKIKIPKKAFVNKNGEDIVGDVEIQYREFHNQADIIASGIPMEYDSAGIKSTLESAGMFDIKGFQNGEPIYINPKKEITVEFSSSQPDDRFNQYVLDTIAKNWNYIKHDVPLQPKSQLEGNHAIASDPVTDNATTKSLQKKIDEIPPKIETEKRIYSKNISQLPVVVAPTKPGKSVKGRPQFQLEVDYKEFPELAAFKNATFEIGEENKNYNPKLADITWNSAEISEGPQKGKNYILTLKLRDRVEKLIAYPALSGADYDKAIKAYEEKFTDYKSLLAKREAQEKKLKEEFEARQAAYIAEQKNLSEELLRERLRIRKEIEKMTTEVFTEMGNQEKVMRVFRISSFNIYNSDCPNSMPSGATFNPIYVINNNGTNIKPNTIYLISHSRNLVYNLPYGELNYNPLQKYSLCILAKGKMYLCSKESFSAITSSKGNKIPLTELNTNVNDAADLKKAIGI